jgi:hypothetical protein
MCTYRKETNERKKKVRKKERKEGREWRSIVKVIYNRLIWFLF